MGIFTLTIILLDKVGAKESWAYFLGGLILSAYLIISWTLSREGQKKPTFILAQLLVAAVLCAAAWFAKDIYFGLPMAIGGAILLLGNSIRYKRGRDDLHVWDFTHKLWTGVGFAVVGSCIFLVGILAIRFALNSLFGIDIKWMAEELILPIGLGFLAPLYWMSTLPQADEPYLELHDNPGFVSKAVAFLGTWLLTPLILIYALILLAYGAKIALAGSLPKGEIAQLALPFIFIGTLNWLILEPPFIKEKALAKLFRRVWFWLMIPVSILLGMAIAERIANYGLTIERILLLLCVIWALGISVWFALRKETYRDIRFIPGFAAALLFAAAIGAPIISVHNQDKRFGKFMKKSGLVSVDNVLTQNITDKDAAQKAKGALQYLYRTDENRRIERRLAKFGVSMQADKADEVYKALSLDQVDLFRERNSGINWRDDDNFISVEGYDFVTGELQFYENSKDTRPIFKYVGLDIQLKNSHLIGREGQAVVFDTDLTDVIDEFGTADGTYLITDPHIVLYKDENREIKLQFRSLNQWGNNETNGSFYLLSSGFEPKAQDKKP